MMVQPMASTLQSSLFFWLCFSLAGLGIAVAQDRPADEEEFTIEFDLGEEEEDTVSSTSSGVVSGGGMLTNELAFDTVFDGDSEHVFRTANRLSLSLESPLSDTLSLKMSGRIGWWSWFEQDGDKRYQLVPELRDSYLYWRVPQVFDLSVGMQTFSWGVSNVFSVQDILNPTDLTDGLSASLETPKLPVFSFSLYRALADWGGLQLVWIPFFQMDRIPVFGSDYSVLDESISSSSATFSTVLSQLESLPSPMIEDLQPLLTGSDRPEASLANSSVSSRMTATFGGVDMGISYHYGWDRTPVFQLDERLALLEPLLASGASLEEAGLALFEPDNEDAKLFVEQLLGGEIPLSALFASRYRRMHLVAVDLAWGVGDFLLRIESAFMPRKVVYTQDMSALSPGAVLTTAGLEYSYGTTWMIGVEAHHQHLLDLPENTSLFMSAQDEVRVALTTALRLLEYDALEIQMGVLYGVAMKDWMIFPSLTYRFNDAYGMTLGAKIFEGETGSLGSLYDRNDEVYVLSRWNF